MRWLDDATVAIAEPERGIAKVALTSGRLVVRWLPEWPRSSGPGTVYRHLAVSDDRIASADFAFMVRWHARKDGESGMLIAEYIADLDVAGDRLLISGMRRDDKGKLGRDGATAWLGTLSGGERSLKPILPFRERKAVEDCAGFGLGVVRFLRTGAFIVIPGTEPDIYLYDSAGHLRRTWATDALGVDAQCRLTPEQKSELWIDPPAREAWVNRRTTIDDVFETPAGPAVIIRTRKDGRTSWDLALLDDEKPERLTLPFTSSSAWAHVEADSRGGKIAFLIGDGTSRFHDAPPPRIVLVRWGDR